MQPACDDLDHRDMPLSKSKARVGRPPKVRRTHIIKLLHCGRSENPNEEKTKVAQFGGLLYTSLFASWVHCNRQERFVCHLALTGTSVRAAKLTEATRLLTISPPQETRSRGSKRREEESADKGSKKTDNSEELPTPLPPVADNGQ